MLLVPGVALLVELIGAFLLVDDLLDSAGKIDALHLWDCVTLLSELLATFLLDVISSLAILLVLEAALLAGDSLLNRLLGDPTFLFLNIGTDSISDIMALPPGHRVVDSLRNLLTNLLGDLAAYGLWSSPDR